MKIAFLQAEEPGNMFDVQLPVGIACLEAVLTCAGHEVDILWRNADLLTSPRLKERLSQLEPDVLCISLCWSVLKQAEALVPFLKEHCPGKPVIVGGPGVTFCPEFVLQKTAADIAIVGEGEIALLRIVNNIDRFPVIPDGIPGTAYTKKDGTFVHNGFGVPPPLEAIPLPAWDKYPMQRYMAVGSYLYRSLATSVDRVIQWTTSRGCPFHCHFCASGVSAGYKSIEQVEYELEEIHHRFFPTFVAWMDNLTISNKQRCLEFCEMMAKNGWGHRFYVSGHAGTMDREMLVALKQAGCVGIMYGIESANDHILKAMNKKQTVEQLEAVIRWTKESGIIPQLSVMFGYPGETKEDWNRTLNMMLSGYDREHPGANGMCPNPVKIFPGTALYDYAINNGIIADMEDYYQKFFSKDMNYIGLCEEPEEEVLWIYNYARFMNERQYHKSFYECYDAQLAKSGDTGNG